MVSKTKIGAALAGIGAVLTTAGAMFSGTLDIGSGIAALATEVGIVLAVFGIRDWPIINRVK